MQSHGNCVITYIYVPKHRQSSYSKPKYTSLQITVIIIYLVYISYIFVRIENHAENGFGYAFATHTQEHIASNFAVRRHVVVSLPKPYPYCVLLLIIISHMR